MLRAVSSNSIFVLLQFSDDGQEKWHMRRVVDIDPDLLRSGPGFFRSSGFRSIPDL